MADNNTTSEALHGTVQITCALDQPALLTRIHTNSSHHAHLNFHNLYPSDLGENDVNFDVQQWEPLFRLKSSRPTDVDQHPPVFSSFNNFMVPLEAAEEAAGDTMEEKALNAAKEMVEFVGISRKACKFTRKTRQQGGIIDDPVALTGGTAQIMITGQRDVNYGDILVYRLPHPGKSRTYRVGGTEFSKVLPWVEPLHPSDLPGLSNIKKVLGIDTIDQMNVPGYNMSERVSANHRLAMTWRIHSLIVAWAAITLYKDNMDAFNNMSIAQAVGLLRHKEAITYQFPENDSSYDGIRRECPNGMRLDKLLTLVATGMPRELVFGKESRTQSRVTDALMNAGRAHFASYMEAMQEEMAWVIGKATRPARAGDFCPVILQPRFI